MQRRLSGRQFDRHSQRDINSRRQELENERPRKSSGRRQKVQRPRSQLTTHGPVPGPPVAKKARLRPGDDHRVFGED